MKERTVFTLVIITIVILTAGYLVATNLDVMPEAASSRAGSVDQLARILIGISTVVFLLVEGALIYAVIRFRKRAGDESDAAPFHGNNTLEIVWTLIPAFIVVFIAFYSFQVLADIEKPSSDELVVEVVGRQFLWQFRYPEYDLTTQELRLPVGKPVRLEITSADVIHSFWVPAFRAKRDATPGQVSELEITPTKVGVYPIRCAELCGPGHAAMHAEVHVETESDFLAWIELSQGSVTKNVQEGEVPAQDTETPTIEIDGAELFLSSGCGACHTLEDASTTGVLGPPLDELDDVAGLRVLGLDPAAYVKQSILEPNAFVVDGYPSNIMPTNFGDQLDVDEIEVLVSYLLDQ